MTDIWEYDGKKHVPIYIRKLVVKDGVESLADYAFMNCTQLVSVDIPGSVKRIGKAAFKGCKSLHSITIPGVRSLGFRAFEDCSQLISIDIPDTVTIIRESVFEGCRSLQSINLTGVKSIQQRAFMQCTQLVSVDIPDSVTEIGASTFSGCSSLESVSISNVKLIDVCTFYDCSHLVSVDIPDSVIRIGPSAFDGCSSLHTIHLPQNIEMISNSSFRGCKSLMSVNLHQLQLLTTIGDRAFHGCTALPSIQFPSSLQNIRKEAFFGCSSITTLELPPSVRSLSSGCFDRCPLTSVILPPGTFVSADVCVFQITSLKSIQFFSSRNDRKPDLQDFQFLVNVIQSSPEIAQIPCTNDGVLPMHFSLTHGFAYELENITTILKAAPDVLSVRDPVYHMYPFLLAACSPISCPYCPYDLTKKDVDFGKLQCTYMLLREEPHVMSFLINNIMSSRV